DGRCELGKIAVRTGFADQSHLSRWVRRGYGGSLTQLTPGSGSKSRILHQPSPPRLLTPSPTRGHGRFPPRTRRSDGNEESAGWIIGLAGRTPAGPGLFLFPTWSGAPTGHPLSGGRVVPNQQEFVFMNRHSSNRQTESAAVRTIREEYDYIV